MKETKPCENNQLFLEQYLDNELSYAESAAMESHISHCESCRSHAEKIRQIKKAIREIHRKERLSSSERLFFENLIAATPSSDRFSLRGFLTALPRPVLSLVGAVSIATVIVILLHARLAQIDRENESLVGEIVRAHESKLPDEFSTADIESVMRKNLEFPHARLPRFIKDNSIIKARFSQIGKHPFASVKVTGPHGNGTLMVTRKNEDLKRIFTHATCVPDLTCRAQRLSREGKDILFWEDHGGNYLFVTSDHLLADHVVNLVSNEGP